MYVVVTVSLADTVNVWGDPDGEPFLSSEDAARLGRKLAREDRKQYPDEPPITVRVRKIRGDVPDSAT
jgi:hypothetical protein